MSTITSTATEPIDPNSAPVQEKPSRPTSMASMAGMQKRSHREVRFGAYVLGSTLGEGEFGKVKLGWRKDGKHPSQVAIKLIKRDTIMKDSESEVKIYREINSLRLLNHPNIVNLVEVLKSGKYIGIVLEYASGGELFDYILRHKYLKENVAKKLFAQLVSGVDYMHSKGLIHRDLKLENLLLDKHKNIIISDFGFVNSYNQAKNDLMKTSCGSPCYAAPELVLTQSPYSGRKVDVWSIGVILYAMLAGYLPFDDDAENEDGADIVRLYNYICNNPITFPEYVSPLARDLLRKIIVPDPTKRIGIDEIRSHPWLAPHANLLSIRQPEWDKIHLDEKEATTTTRMLNQNKHHRYSMFNEPTTSSPSLVLNTNKPSHGRSYTSSSNIIYSHPTTSYSFANVVALPGDNKLNNSASSINSAASSLTSQAHENYSPTKFSQSAVQRGHSKSASMSGTYPSASHALKAVVSEHDKSLEDTTLPQAIASPVENVNRSSTYLGSFSTIVESPTRSESESKKENTSGISMTTHDKLPTTQKRPRPTSYHPSSMTSTLMSLSGGSSVILDYMKTSPQMNVPVPPFFSGSPTKSLKGNESIHSANEYVAVSPGSPKNLPPRNTRRDSVVTAINVNGVLTSDLTSHENKRNSVFSYLEDKMEGLELTDSHSPTRTAWNDSDSKAHQEIPKLDLKLAPTDFTPKIDQSPKFSASADAAAAEVDSIKKVDTTETTAPEHATTDTSNDASSASPPTEKEESVGSEITEASSIPAVEKEASKVGSKEGKDKSDSAEKKRVSSQAESVPRREKKREPKEVTEAKKKNRFSLLSFYGTATSSSPAPSSSRKVLEPSNAANLGAASGRENKPIDTTGSNASNQARRLSTSTENGGNYTNAKEANAARKVMNFFKRRSVRLG